MLNAIITNNGLSGCRASASLLGHNLELFQFTNRDLASDRLENPKFAGPAHGQTGIAREWTSPSSNFMGIRYELTAGEGIMGSEAQLMQSTSDRKNKGLVQHTRWVRKGENLDVTLWARAIHTPVILRVGVRPPSIWSHDYASADIHVDSAVWKEYRATLTMPKDDDAAVFFCWLEEPGLVSIDQIHLRPAGSSVIREDVLRTLGEFDIPQLRFPGGCLTTSYHWQFGTGPHYTRPVLPDPVFKREMNYEFGTDEYLDFCTRYGIVPHLTVNIGTGTPDEATRWAAYCADWYRARGMEPPLMYWQLGNEHYGHWERAHMTGEMYARVIRDLVPGIRDAYPSARIVALGQETCERLHNEKGPWRAPVLDMAGDVIDAIALQVYSILPISDDVAEQHRWTLEAAERTAGEMQRAYEDCRARDLDLRIGMSEWNLWLHASHFAPQGFQEPMDIQHGLFVTTMRHHFTRLAPVMEFSNLYHIIAGMGIFSVDKNTIRKSHVADIYTLYRPAYPGGRIDVAIDSPEIVPGAPAIEALALANDAGTWLFLVNRSLDEDAAVTLDGFANVREGVTLAGKHPYALEAQSHEVQLNGNQITLPPLSITRLQWEA